MLISFSEPAMLPYIRAGIRQARGEDVAVARVKRQTIRRIGPRAEQLLAYDPIGHTIPYDLQLYWKVRTPQRPRGWRRGDSMLFWSPGDEPNGFYAEAIKDGFESPEAFRDYFVPNFGDRFDGILFKW